MSSKTSYEFLHSLNAVQLQSVLHDPSIPLQILAGPGSGKTKVLTSRIAYLILHHGLPASSICAVTFTNKAANEMRERLGKLIGKQKTAHVRMGTFHALCALFLRKYAQVVGIGQNFTVCDADESKKIIAGLLKPYKEVLAAQDLTLKDGTVLSLISRAKAKGLSAKDMMGECTSKVGTDNELDRIVARIYQDYEKALRRSNSLDFDDLLVYGVRLFSEHLPSRNWCRHVLVDEFQDTNVTQYELLRALGASTEGRVTVVGDPDQSIYGWRSAEVGNLARMKTDFHGTLQIFLEENYRSTGAILKASLAIVSQDKTRIPKTLLTSHPQGVVPVLRPFPSEQDEANFIAVEIKRLVASTGGVLRWGDFAILLRFNALSRAIESALQKEAIPCVILGGHKFFERQEIKDILAYLQLVDNPNFVPALTRAINVPSRSIGEKSIAALIDRAEKTRLSPLEVVEHICDAKQPDVKPALKHKLVSFVKAIRVLRQLADEGASPPDLIRRLLELVEYEDHLKRTQDQWESRWENVQELITFASEVELSEDSDTTPLRSFLQASMLSSEGDNQSEEDSKEKVTISTCHSAKGLEWPVVMIPAVEGGIFPFYRAEDVQEERRLLYVACTRAQSLLYLSHVMKRKAGGEIKTKDVSEFVSTAVKKDSTVFSSRASQFSAAERRVVCNVLRRPEASEEEVDRRVAEFRKTARYLALAEVSGKVPEVTWHPALTALSPNSATFATAGHQVPLLKRGLTSVQTGKLPAGFHSESEAVRVPVRAQVEKTAHLPSGSHPIQSQTIPVKRRLGMGRGTMGFPNKKFKPPFIQ